MKPLRASSIILAVVAAVALGCSSRDNPPAAGENTNTPGPTATATATGTAPPSGRRDSGTDAGADAAPPRACGSELPAERGDIVEEHRTSEPTLAAGGVVEPGTYVLRDWFVSTAASDSGVEEPPPGQVKTGRIARSTLVVKGSELLFIEARGTAGTPLAADTETSYHFAIVGNELSLEQRCPAAQAPRKVGFNAVGKQLALLVDPTHREVYLRLDP